MKANRNDKQSQYITKRTLSKNLKNLERHRVLTEFLSKNHTESTHRTHKKIQPPANFLREASNGQKYCLDEPKINLQPISNQCKLHQEFLLRISNITYTESPHRDPHRYPTQISCTEIPHRDPTQNPYTVLHTMFPHRVPIQSFHTEYPHKFFFVP